MVLLGKYTSSWLQFVCRLQLPIFPNTDQFFFFLIIFFKELCSQKSLSHVMSLPASVHSWYKMLLLGLNIVKWSNFIFLILDFFSPLMFFFSVILIMPLQFWCNFCMTRCTSASLVMRHNSSFWAMLPCVQSGSVYWCLGQDAAIRSACESVLRISVFGCYHEQMAAVDAALH